MKIISLALSLLIFLGPFPVLSAEPAADKEYFIEAGDVISVNVFPATEFSKEVTVQPDGNIEIPMLGSIKASGVKPGELEKILTARFSKYVSDPAITLNVRRFSSSRVAIIGQIRGAGYYEFREGMRLLDLVAQAGGLQDYPRGSKVRIFRKVKGEGDKLTEQVVQADLDEVMSGNMEKNIPLVTGDIVYVPRKGYYSAARWMTDNFTPWATLFMFAITAGIVARKN